MQSLRTFQSTFGVSDTSTFSAHSAVKREDIVISLKNSTVPGSDAKPNGVEEVYTFICICQ